MLHLLLCLMTNFYLQTGQNGRSAALVTKSNYKKKKNIKISYFQMLEAYLWDFVHYGQAHKKRSSPLSYFTSHTKSKMNEVFNHVLYIFEISHIKANHTPIQPCSNMDAKEVSALGPSRGIRGYLKGHSSHCSHSSSNLLSSLCSNSTPS